MSVHICSGNLAQSLLLEAADINVVKEMVTAVSSFTKRFHSIRLTDSSFAQNLILDSIMSSCCRNYAFDSLLKNLKYFEKFEVFLHSFFLKYK